jgi:porphobilinogen synthase
MRRLRRTPALRRMVRETRLAPADLVQPLFVCHGSGVREPIEALPGQMHLSIDAMVEEAARLHAAGVAAVILFGLPGRKDEAASAAYDEEGIVQMALRALRKEVPDLVAITDVCLCQYTSHGHCGVVRDGAVDNDITLELLAQTAVSHAAAGADIVAPSDMMDGRVSAIRAGLDAEGFSGTSIMAYSAKFASAFYGPFREAAHSAPAHGDRRGYQMDPANGREALREVLLDLEEGADVVMVKPALPYLDVIRAAREATQAPVAAYQVSGEYAMIAAAAARGVMDERAAALEALTAIKRAGADLVVTYYAGRACEWL